MVTDPISDLLVRLQNASRVGHSQVSLPYSQMKHAIAQILAKEGYVGDVSKKAHALGVLESHEHVGYRVGHHTVNSRRA